ncbi:MAG: hypothetical protein ACTSQQ_12405, partial [Candidatus Helarchaeota archaeon]
LFEYVDSIVILKDVEKLVTEFEIQGIKILAHNKYFRRANLQHFAEILLENNIYFEINTRYLSYIDTGGLEKLRELKDHGVKFTVGSDAHNMGRIGDIAPALALLNKINGIDHLINIESTLSKRKYKRKLYRSSVSADAPDLGCRDFQLP